MQHGAVATASHDLRKKVVIDSSAYNLSEPRPSGERAVFELNLELGHDAICVF